jgi:DNA-directed RNA polymerase specialized sigma24 family protein
VNARSFVIMVIIPLILAEVGPWCGWLASRLLPCAARLRYGNTERATVRLQEWSADLNDIPGQLTKLTYAAGQCLAGSAAYAQRTTKRHALSKQTKPDRAPRSEPGVASTLVAGAEAAAIRHFHTSAVISALRTLPAPQREALVLRYYLDLSEGQIAAAMKTSTAMVQDYTVQAKGALRRALLQDR